jgi:stress response protein SCP2
MCAATVAALRKGENVTLSVLAEELGSVSVILEWVSDNDHPLDADVSVLLVGDDSKVRSNDTAVRLSPGPLGPSDHISPTGAGHAGRSW